MWCRHKWEESERFYDKAEGISKLSGGVPEDNMKLLLGVTTILYRCRKCGHPKTVEILGKSTKNNI